jgi:hypothetical protein
MNRSFVLSVVVLALTMLVASEMISATTEPVTCMDDKTREAIRELAIEGLKKAFQEHTQHLFEIWVKDNSDQPRRAKVGMAAGIDAYARARADMLRWNPPSCT